jgi:hypothetical protein
MEVSFVRLLLPYFSNYVPKWAGIDFDEQGQAPPCNIDGSSRGFKNSLSREKRLVYLGFRSVWNSYRNTIWYEGITHQQWVCNILNREREMR